jgi:hypothetical protein
MNFVPNTRSYQTFNQRFQEIKSEAKTPPYLIDLIERATMLYRDLRFVRDLPNVTKLMDAIRELVNSKIQILLFDEALIRELIAYNNFKCDFSKSGFLQVGNNAHEFSEESQGELIQIAVDEYKAMGGTDEFNHMLAVIQEIRALKVAQRAPWAARGIISGSGAGAAPSRAIKPAAPPSGHWEKNAITWQEVFTGAFREARDKEIAKLQQKAPTVPTGPPTFKKGGAYTRKGYARRNKKTTRSLVRKHKNAKFA